MKLVVGLGNPGKEYENTRHNTGRIIVGLVQKKLDPKQKIKFLYETVHKNSVDFKSIYSVSHICDLQFLNLFLLMLEALICLASQN